MKPHGPWHPAVLSTLSNGKKELRLEMDAASDHAEAFTSEGLDGSGIDWQAAFSHAMKKRDKAVWTLIEFDSEASAFIATSRDQTAIEGLGALVKELLSNRHALERAVRERG